MKGETMFGGLFSSGPFVFKPVAETKQAELDTLATQLADKENEIAELKAGLEVARLLICELSQRPTLDEFRALMRLAAQPQPAESTPQFPVRALQFSA